ncbi:hypothetical protein AMTRI_Chr06g177980 [Amborella trichopoda]|uniref:ApaG domain-containing protein n=1 Tax=Amborella trichopoda TaxID=13333 RepID=U5DIB6_AMBTC|nr:F-box protein SKIP16 [Amborella trichopoda]ERN20323.1 hypothetical protein AMTR_s00066p00189030 [Amborella trichopoda]|eukprot:XP_006858856.1 F-box protein SKIP16 [Amborella trichopoda]
MAFEGVGDMVLHLIIEKLGPKQTAAISCLNKHFKAVASDEVIWSQFCSSDFQISTPQDPLGKPCSSFKEAYKLWNKEFGMYPWPLVRRVKLCLDAIKTWVSENFQEAASTLQKGASEAELEAVEEALGVKFPLPTRVFYRFCNGQDTGRCFSDFKEDPCLLGLIGGYCFYDYSVDVHLLPLNEIVTQTRHLTRRIRFSRKRKLIVVASSCNLRKIFFLDCTDGLLYVNTKYRKVDINLMACVPGALVNTVHALDSGDQQDGMLLWLEEFARRLQSGVIGVREENNARSICLYPETPPLCSTAVTRGVQVRASAVFVPELSDLDQPMNKYLFSYSIRMHLLPLENSSGNPMSSCQLYWRHWIIRANDAIISDVSDKAVIGKHPLLREGGKEFVYQSCTSSPLPSGSIEGSFTFVPGRLNNPQGGQFDAEVAQFPLELPDYIF